MSYFEAYFNVRGERTLRAYALPLELSRFDSYDWLCSDSGVDAIEQALEHRREIPLITAEMAAALVTLDPRSYDAGTLGSNPDGFYVPRNRAAGQLGVPECDE